MMDLNNQRISNRSLGHSDGTTVFEVSKFLAVGGILVVLLLTSAWIRHEILSLQYELEEVRMNNAQLSEGNMLLRAEYNSIATPAEIEKTAERLGLISANDAQVIIMEGDFVEPVLETQVARSRGPQEILHE